MKIEELVWSGRQCLVENICFMKDQIYSKEPEMSMDSYFATVCLNIPKQVGSKKKR